MLDESWIHSVTTAQDFSYLLFVWSTLSTPGATRQALLLYLNLLSPDGNTRHNRKPFIQFPEWKTTSINQLIHQYDQYTKTIWGRKLNFDLNMADQKFQRGTSSLPLSRGYKRGRGYDGCIQVSSKSVKTNKEVWSYELMSESRGRSIKITW